MLLCPTAFVKFMYEFNSSALHHIFFPPLHANWIHFVLSYIDVDISNWYLQIMTELSWNDTHHVECIFLASYFLLVRILYWTAVTLPSKLEIIPLFWFFEYFIFNWTLPSEQSMTYIHENHSKYLLRLLVNFVFFSIFYIYKIRQYLRSICEKKNSVVYIRICKYSKAHWQWLKSSP